MYIRNRNMTKLLLDIKIDRFKRFAQSKDVTIKNYNITISLIFSCMNC